MQEFSCHINQRTIARSVLGLFRLKYARLYSLLACILLSLPIKVAAQYCPAYDSIIKIFKASSVEAVDELLYGFGMRLDDSDYTLSIKDDLSNYLQERERVLAKLHYSNKHEYSDYQTITVQIFKSSSQEPYVFSVENKLLINESILVSGLSRDCIDEFKNELAINGYTRFNEISIGNSIAIQFSGPYGVATIYLDHFGYSIEFSFFE